MNSKKITKLRKRMSQELKRIAFVIGISIGLTASANPMPWAGIQAIIGITLAVFGFKWLMNEILKMED